LGEAAKLFVFERKRVIFTVANYASVVSIIIKSLCGEGILKWKSNLLGDKHVSHYYPPSLCFALLVRLAVGIEMK
jgi:hypothetical protein